jgi:dipeptidyl aminopeptidase/acylaminoacyl peptidase
MGLAMRSTKRFVGFFSVCLVQWALAAPPTAAPSVDAFGSMPAESAVVLSPDGRRLAWVDRTEPKPRIIMFDVANKKRERAFTVPENLRLSSIQWNDNETLLAGYSERGSNRFRTVALDASGGAERILPNGTLIATRLAKPHTVIMSITSPAYRCLIEVNTATTDNRVIKTGNKEFTAAWVVNHDGQAVAREDWDWRNNAYDVLSLANEKPRTILSRKDSNPPKLAGVLADGSALVLLDTNGHAHQAAWALPLNGSPLKLIAEDPNADITNAYQDPYTGAIVGVYLSGNVTKIRWLDAAAQHRQDVLDKAFAGRDVQIYAWSVDGTKTLARVETASSPPVYYLVDFTAHRADIAAEEYPALADVPLAEVKQISYKARDGTEIPAYLTRPAAKSSSAAPLVVLPHGGPQSRDYLTFNWIVQFLASRGYVVLQPQFRGSIGFGEAFEQAGYRQWGGLMQDDVTDAVHAMIEQGIADPHRVCIVGIGYGGYAALAGAAFTPDVYTCAVSIDGYTDIVALLRANTPADNHYNSRTNSNRLDSWEARVGGLGNFNLSRRSPINSAKSINIPILLVYSTADGAMLISQSERMAKALEDNGKEVKVTKIQDADGWLWHSKARVQVLTEIEAFLAQSLQGSSETSRSQ